MRSFTASPNRSLRLCGIPPIDGFSSPSMRIDAQMPRQELWKMVLRPTGASRSIVRQLIVPRVQPSEDQGIASLRLGIGGWRSAQFSRFSDFSMGLAAADVLGGLRGGRGPANPAKVAKRGVLGRLDVMRWRSLSWKSRDGALLAHNACRVEL